MASQYELMTLWREKAEEKESEGRSLEYEDDSTTVMRREVLFAEALVYRECANGISAMTF